VDETGLLQGRIQVTPGCGFYYFPGTGGDSQVGDAALREIAGHKSHFRITPDGNILFLPAIPAVVVEQRVQLAPHSTPDPLETEKRPADDSDMEPNQALEVLLWENKRLKKELATLSREQNQTETQELQKELTKAQEYLVTAQARFDREHADAIRKIKVLQQQFAEELTHSAEDRKSCQAKLERLRPWQNRFKHCSDQPAILNTNENHSFN
jgi:hypothetical protein